MVKAIGLGVTLIIRTREDTASPGRPDYTARRMAEFNLWLLILGIAAGAAVTWLVIGTIARNDDDVAASERAAEATWIGRTIEEHGGRRHDIAIYGQEINHTTWRLAKMNLAVQGIDADIRWNNEGSFHKDELKDKRFDFALANPLFNTSDWGGERLREDPRWKYGAPPSANANYAWVQHFLHHLAPTGLAGFVLANGSMSSNQSGEGDIRKNLIAADRPEKVIAVIREAEAKL